MATPAITAIASGSVITWPRSPIQPSASHVENAAQASPAATLREERVRTGM